MGAWQGQSDAANGITRSTDLQLRRNAFQEPGGAGMGGSACAGVDCADRQSPWPEPFVQTSSAVTGVFYMSSSALPNTEPINGKPAHLVQVKHEDVVIDCDIRELYYGAFKAVRDTTIPIKKNSITAFIGPSGCGKSTVLRCLNRMNDLVRGFRFEGHVR